MDAVEEINSECVEARVQLLVRKSLPRATEMLGVVSANLLFTEYILDDSSRRLDARVRES